jgi:hypothetical protein
MDRSKTLVRLAIILFLCTFGMLGYLLSWYLVAGTLGPSDLTWLGVTWQDLVSMNPHLALLISEYIRWFASVGLCYLACELFLVYLVFWKDSKPAWYILVLTLLALIITDVINEFPIDVAEQAWVLLGIYFILFAAFAIAAVLSWKELHATRA